MSIQTTIRTAHFLGGEPEPISFGLALLVLVLPSCFGQRLLHRSREVV